MPEFLEVLAAVRQFNNSVLVPGYVVNGVTGLLIVMVLLALKAFHKTPSSVFPYSKLIYFSASISLLVAVFISRLLVYPPNVTLSSFLFTLSYLLYAGYTVYSGSKFATVRSTHGNQTINSAKNSESFN